MTNPKEWFNKEVILFFVDPISLTLAKTNGGDGFKLMYVKDWVAGAMPYVKFGLTILKAAAIAGRLSGIPIPDIAGMATQFFDAQIGALSNLTEDPKLATSLLEEVDNHCQDMFKSIAEGIVPKDRNKLAESLKEPLQKSAKELSRLLVDAGYPDWKRDCGLISVTSTKHCTTEWVLSEFEEEFKEKGKALLGTKSCKNSNGGEVALQFALAAAQDEPSTLETAAQDEPSPSSCGCCCWRIN
jgi:hypothetical protein